MAIRTRTKQKSPPILSQEFFIQNHADIVSCVAMVFVLGLLFNATSAMASMFVVMSHNVSDALYTYGTKDLALTFFYTLISIVMHAVIQEYILDRFNKRQLSKVKHSRFNESGQLLVFQLISLVWAGMLIKNESLSRVWTDYPHTEMGYVFKFYFIIQISYWLHQFPELYLQKVRKEDLARRVLHSFLYLVAFISAYLMNFTRLALYLSFGHYLSEALCNVARLSYFLEKEQAHKFGFRVYNLVFLVARLGSITLSVLAFWYGLASQPSAQLPLSVSSGNFNTQGIRIGALSFICLVQAWLMWNFINFHLGKMRERASEQTSKKKSAGKKKVKKAEEDVNDLPEVDQNTKRGLLKRAVKAK